MVLDCGRDETSGLTDVDSEPVPQTRSFTVDVSDTINYFFPVKND